MRQLVSVGKRLVGSLGVDARAGLLVLVTGGGNWAVKEIALALEKHLRPQYSEFEVLDHLSQRPFLSQANIHCLCRPAFFGSEGVADVHPSNRVVVAWLHGGIQSVDRGLRKAAEQLERHWRRVDRLIVPNSVTKREVLECGVDPARVQLIPNGVDTRLFSPPKDGATRHRIRTQLGIAQDAFVIGSFQRDGDKAGNPKPVKAPEVFVETLAKVHAQRPIVALLTGTSRDYVRRRLTELNIPHVYEWLEQITELPAMYHAVDAYLITSREEGGPSSLRESMASGVPVVSTRMGLAVDLIRHGHNGLLAEVDDRDGLARALLELIETPSRRTAMAAEALKTIQPLDYRVIAKRYQDEVYTEVFR